MPGFSVTPLSDMPPQTPQAFPNFLQFQEDGLNLGLNDADTLNFGDGLTATRGTGANANVVSVEAAAAGEGGAAVPTFVLDLEQPYDGAPTFDGGLYTAWSGEEVLAADGIAWDDVEMKIAFSVAGTYRVSVTATVTADPSWPSGGSTYGVTVIGNGTSRHARTHSAGDGSDIATQMRFTDEFICYTDVPLPTSFAIGVYALNAASSTACTVHATVTAQRIGAAP